MTRTTMRLTWSAFCAVILVGTQMAACTIANAACGIEGGGCGSGCCNYVGSTCTKSICSSTTTECYLIDGVVYDQVFNYAVPYYNCYVGPDCTYNGSETGTPACSVSCPGCVPVA